MKMYIKGIEWWHWLFLWILPTTTTTEYESDFKHTTTYKRWLGRIFVLDITWREP